MKFITLMLWCLLLTSCATVRETYTPTGKKGFAINCSGTARGWDMCYKAAGDRCGARGYRVIDRSTEGMGVAGANSSGFWATRTSTRTMLIQCK